MSQPYFYVDVCIDDLWEVAKSLPPQSANYCKVRYAINGLIHIANWSHGAAGSPDKRFAFYANDLDAYERDATADDVARPLAGGAAPGDAQEAR